MRTKQAKNVKVGDIMTDSKGVAFIVKKVDVATKNVALTVQTVQKKRFTVMTRPYTSIDIVGKAA